MKAYKLEILVIDHENIGPKQIEQLIEDNHYINPTVMSIKTRDIGAWTDEHPLNHHDTQQQEFNRLFQ